VSADARAEILARVRAAVAGAPAPAPVPRDYRRTREGEGDHVALFAQRVADYEASVFVVDDLDAAIAERLAERGIERIGVPLQQRGLTPSLQGAVVDDGLSAAELDGLDGALTAAALGIAETGTIVLDGGPGQGRRALSLVPDYHLCIVRADQIVGSVPEAVARLQGVSRPITFISGPSATSDIELDRVEGVHGPRTLDVLVTRGLPSGS
jgi:L-lactate dehydrogenase complex protein LldG